MNNAPPSVLERMLCFEVYSTEHAFSRLYKTLLAPHGLTYPQFLVLVLLWQQDDQTVNGLGVALGLESSTLTPLLKRMERTGLVARARDAEDERRVRVSLTEEGYSLQAKVKGIASCVADATGMSEEELMTVIASMKKLRGGLEASVRGGAKLPQ
ncbi:MarR family transcriptional regulator [Shimia sp. NS0008-38b]|uniref:MarR family winged helix-turn-helix transcriptional regulator n=1 Tax=Shimia sp. NS0008-38b TaxID=3127653 RepID=UPI00310AF8C6